MGPTATALLFLCGLVAVRGQVSVDPVSQETVQCTLSDGTDGECASYYLCGSDNKTIVDGSYLIDIRAYGECSIMEMCCGLPDILPPDTDNTLGTGGIGPVTGGGTGPRPGTGGTGTGGGTGPRPGTGGTGTGGGTGPRPGTGGTGTGGTGPRPGTGGTGTGGTGTGGTRPGTGNQNVADLKKCGVRNKKGVLFQITGGDKEAQFGEFPWMVAILKEGPTINSKKLYVYQCGGSLIHPKVVLTAAHCVTNITDPSSLRVRAGEYDTAITTEYLLHQDMPVKEISVHKHHYKAALFNDVALLFLTEPIKLDQHIRVACIPKPADKVQANKNCFVTGWGKDDFGKQGSYQNILKKIELPVVDNKKCQADLRTTRLGKRFELHNSFMCAGGVPGKDACTGDGGSPLVCPMEGDPERYEQIGIVAWGIGCNTNIPGVYANIPYLRDWIDDEMIYKSILDMDQYQDNSITS